MVIALVISLAVVTFLLLWGIGVYNRLVKLKNLMTEGWSTIDVFLKKRYDLIPNLVDSVKGYASHEKETFENVALARSRTLGTKDVASRAASENALENVLGRLMLVAEKYPELQANENFMYLQKELSRMENEIERARRYYNGTVRENNIAIETFPTNLVAGLFHFTKGEFYEAGEKEREVPQTSLSE